MSLSHHNGWQEIQSDLLRRIQEREWLPGDLIPKETDFAEEYGCARTTVNRALNAIADRGLLDRKRKAGTRIAVHPTRKATVTIPIIRQEIEAKNLSYSYALIDRKVEKPPAPIAARLQLDPKATALRIKALYLAGNKPYVLEDRWINTETLSEALKIDFSSISANEWLVATQPYTRGDFAFTAMNATEQVAKVLGASPNDALFVLNRATYHGDAVITAVELTYHPGYVLHTDW